MRLALSRMKNEIAAFIRLKPYKGESLIRVTVGSKESTTIGELKKLICEAVQQETAIGFEDKLEYRDAKQIGEITDACNQVIYKDHVVVNLLANTHPLQEFTKQIVLKVHPKTALQDQEEISKVEPAKPNMQY